MKAVGRSPTAKAGGNMTKRLRIDLASDLSEREIAECIGGAPTKEDMRSAKRLPAEMWEKVTAQHIWKAVQKLKAGDVQHSFGESTDYDLVVDDGIRLPPKAVFGIAASEALGFEVLPEHFSGGLHTACFRILGVCGFPIVEKGKATNEPSIPNTAEDDEWSEGKPRWVRHLKRERARGLSQAKKAAFRNEHQGRLYCERCSLDPIKQHGEVGEACIEVHHRNTQVKDMDEGHVTKLGFVDKRLTRDSGSDSRIHLIGRWNLERTDWIERRGMVDHWAAASGGARPVGTAEPG